MQNTSKAIRAMMVREGATFHKCVESAEMAHMGGGMGIVVNENIKANTVIATIPPNCMITTSKCRYHLALIEQYMEELSHQEELQTQLEKETEQTETKEMKWKEEQICVNVSTENVSGNNETERKLECLEKVRTCTENKVKLQLEDGQLIFPANEFTEEEKRQELGDDWYTRVHQVEERLYETLSPAETITCYLVLMAALYNRLTNAPMIFTSTQSTTTLPSTEAEAEKSEKHKACVIRFMHENKWMRLWILSLPPGCDNLLELPLFDSERDYTSNNDDDNNVEACQTGVDDSLAVRNRKQLPSPFLFARQEKKVKEEKENLYKSFMKCKNALHCLSHLPLGEEVSTNSNSNFEENSSLPLPAEMKLMITNDFTQMRGSSNTNIDNQKTKITTEEITQRTCTYEMFTWAFNMLMSRGFSYSKEVWAMMPWVDYFNYNRYGNCTMYECTYISINEKGNIWREEKHNRVVSNDDDNATCTVFVNSERSNNKCYRFISTEPICQGSELTISYGAYSDFELLLWYGFAIRESLLLFEQCTELYEKIVEKFGLKTLKEEKVEIIEWKEKCREYCGCHSTEQDKSLAAFLSIFTDEEYGVKYLADAKRCSLALSTMPWEEVYKKYVEIANVKKICSQQNCVNVNEVNKNNSNTEKEHKTVVGMEQRADEFESSVISFDEWCIAVNHAFSVPLSPLADADGNYHDQTLNNNWIEELCLSYSEKTDEEVLKE